MADELAARRSASAAATRPVAAAGVGRVVAVDVDLPRRRISAASRGISSPGSPWRIVQRRSRRAQALVELAQRRQQVGVAVRRAVAAAGQAGLEAEDRRRRRRRPPRRPPAPGCRRAAGRGGTRRCRRLTARSVFPLGGGSKHRALAAAGPGGQRVGSGRVFATSEGAEHGVLRHRRNRLHRPQSRRAAARARGHDLRARPRGLAGPPRRAPQPLGRRRGAGRRDRRRPLAAPSRRLRRRRRAAQGRTSITSSTSPPSTT